MPAMSRSQGCFCCEPMSSVVDSQEMTSQQLQEQTLTTSLPSSYEDHSSVAQNISRNVTEPPWLYDICLSNLPSHPTSQLDWNNLHGNDLPAQLNNELEMCHIQDQQQFLSASKSSVTSDLEEQSSYFNFHVLQNRELGGKHSRIMTNEMKPLLPSSDTFSHYYRERILDSGSDNTVVSATNRSSADSMDLDSALDELGMLSTVTNSRREYLLETQGQASLMKCDHRLRSKSESSPNLTTIYRTNGYHVVRVNSKFVAGLSGALIFNDRSSLSGHSPSMSESPRLKLRNSNIPEEVARHQRSVPRMSRMRKDRYLYRRSRCPYNLPYRLGSAMQESSTGPEYLCSYDSSFMTSATLSENEAHSDRLTNCQESSEFKSDVSSPEKSKIDASLVRSLSAEHLTHTNRHLENDLNTDKGSHDTEQKLDSMTSQMTHLHMS